MKNIPEKTMKTTNKIPSLSSLIKKGNLGYVNSNITAELFPAPKIIRNDFKLYHFNKRISSEDAVKEMEKDGYAPANIYELLSWKEWNGTDWVVGLGSVHWVDGDRHVPCLTRGGSERILYLSWWDADWDSDCRFLGVRNSELGSSDTRTGHLETLALGAPCPHCGKLVRVNFSK